MSIINLIKTAISSLRFHKLRTFLTMIGIIIGISSVVAILSVGNGFKDYVVKSSEDVNANKINVYFKPENSEASIKLLEPFSKSDIYGIKNIPGVEKAEPSKGGFGGFTFSAGQIGYFNKSEMALIDAYDGKTKKVEYGRWFKKGEENEKRIVLQYSTAKNLFNPISDGIGKAVTINGTNYEVIGILPEEKGMTFGPTSSYISKTSKDSMESQDTIGSLDVFVKQGYKKETVFNDVKKYLESSHGNIQGEYKLQDPQEITKKFEDIIGGLTKFIAFITGISLLVGGIGVMNIMYVSVSERKREIGIRRAIGAKPSSILLQFLFEAILVTSIGGLIGILVGYLIAKLAGAFLPFPPVLTLGTFIGATLISIIEGVVFGVIPAYNACKLDPIKAIYR
ncbi:ABC transporter permease [Eubacterium multiforme]|uniref:ABC transport system permease protein n=1 Tax=Eubacterium multiforme TaxID=83339 RepID=A0ABT9UPW7_9FIRM|nr:ABC transporter permease [Eubacterium multiforme]MDQ0148692.1 putative ABC transport system permease protein [Eubacterium multiforme]